jgi:hypothetical protein
VPSPAVFHDRSRSLKWPASARLVQARVKTRGNPDTAVLHAFTCGFSSQPHRRQGFAVLALGLRRQ